ncbi:MAG TPA: response regulator transcription factor [Thermoanaerobaculia bacterium]
MRTVAIIHRAGASAGALKSAIEAEGYRAECFTRRDAAVAAIRRRGYSLVLLDLEVDDGYELCRVAHEAHPVICLTDDNSDASCVRAFESGADDCICRPFSFRELVARIRNLLSRTEGARDESVALDAVEIFISAMRIRVGGRMMELTRGETEILALLVEHAPAPLTVSRMLEMLPAGSEVKRGTVESRIKSLRRKLGADRLVNRGGFGYQLVA